MRLVNISWNFYAKMKENYRYVYITNIPSNFCKFILYYYLLKYIKIIYKNKLKKDL